MAKAKIKPAQEVRLPSPYEAVGLRIQKIINSPAAQKLKLATVSKLPGESAEDWEGVLELLGELDNVTMEFLDDGSVEISWVKPEED
jgi:hypothetical protein